MAAAYLVNASDPDTLRWDLENRGMKLTREGELAPYLGIDFQRDTAKQEIRLTQTTLIAKIVKATHLQHGSNRTTPASAAKLGPSKPSEKHNKQWSYASVVGMLMYVANNTRPDIAVAVHQVARYTHDPRVPHSEAVLRIVKYLKATRLQGLCFSPKLDAMKLDCYVDADFAGLWGAEDPNNPSSVKSRSGYVFFLSGCPLLWKSKLQTTVSLSTTEAEYVALAQAMRELLPLKLLIDELSKTITGTSNYQTVTKSTIFEDNNGCIALARAPIMTPRSKHIAVTYHWWRSHVKAKETVLEKVDTEQQIADILTKPLSEESFVRLRQKLNGW